MAFGCASALWLVILQAGMAAAAQQRFITIGTGSPSGVYFAVGEAICAAVNKDAAARASRGAQLVTSCRVAPSGGSVFNIRQITNGAFTFAIAQGDVQYLAQSGNAVKPLRNVPDLRTVVSMHEEAVLVVMSKALAARSFADLARLRVSLGNEGSGTRMTMRWLADAHGLADEVFSKVDTLAIEQDANALCSDKIDAFGLVSALPVAALSDAVALCDARLLPLDSPVERAIVERSSHLRPITVTTGAEGSEVIPTFSIRAGLVTRERVPDDVVQDVARAIMDNIDLIRAAHPALAGLNPREMGEVGLGAPVHRGAAAYYRERGWQ